MASAIVSTTSLVAARLTGAAGVPATAVLRGGALRLSSVATSEANPLLKFDGLPRFDAIDASHVKPGVSETLAQLEEQFATLEQTLAENESPCYSDVVEAMERIEDPVEYAWGVVGHLMGVKNSDELRAAHGEMQGEVIKTTTKMSQSAAIFKALEVVAKDSTLDAAQKRIVASSLKGMRLSGVALEGAEAWS